MCMYNDSIEKKKEAVSPLKKPLVKGKISHIPKGPHNKLVPFCYFIVKNTSSKLPHGELGYRDWKKLCKPWP